MSDEMQQVKLRLPEELKQRIAVSAERNGRSINSEVVKRLQDSLNTSEKLSTAVTLNMYIEMLDSRIRQILQDHGRLTAEGYQNQRNHVSALLSKVESELEAELGALPIPRHRATCAWEDHPLFGDKSR